jgi:transposase
VLPIARLLRPHVARVVLTEPSAVHESGAAKTDKIDARALARLLASGFAGEVWAPDEETAALRRLLSRRRQLVKQRTREKNQVHAVLMRNLEPRPPMSDVFGPRGRAWLAARPLPEVEREMVEACLRHLDFLDQELAALDRAVARRVLASEEMLRLLQLPGVSAVTAATLTAAIGDISRFPTPRHLVGYLGLNPRVRQSGAGPAKHGRISLAGALDRKPSWFRRQLPRRDSRRPSRFPTVRAERLVERGVTRDDFCNRSGGARVTLGLRP